jgi:hypothetical protein
MQIEQDKKYKSGTLKEYLRSQGLPYSKPTLLNYEAAGIIPSPRSAMPFSEKSTFYKSPRRTYYGYEILNIAEIIRGLVDGTDKEALEKLSEFHHAKRNTTQNALTIDEESLIID